MYTSPQSHITLGTIIRIGIVVLVGVMFLVYMAWQGRFLLLGPSVTFGDIPAAVQTERAITLAGTAENIVRITLNDREISTTPDGYFEEVIVLENGYTVSTITAFDRYGRSRSYEHSFVYAPAFMPEATTTPAGD